MSFNNTDENFVVFASAWNPAETVPVTFHFTVSEAIPENTSLNFTLREFNLLPSAIDTCFFETEFSVNLRPSDPLGFTNSNVDEIKVFPNPSNGIFTIQNIQNNSLLRVMDLSGRILQESISGLNNEFNLPQGIYFINIESKNTTITKRIVVQ
jgi:hypothetical protein